MTVEQLIERLSKLNRDRLVKVRGAAYRSRNIDSDFDDGTTMMLKRKQNITNYDKKVSD